MANRDRYERGLLDTSVLIDVRAVRAEDLPAESVISTLALAELAAGPHGAATATERAERQVHLQQVEASMNPLAFGVTAARAYGRVFAAVSETRRKARGARAVDLMIAASALAEGLPLFTRNPKDFAGLEGLIEVIAV